MTILFISHEDDKVMGSTLSLYNMIHALQSLGCECIVALPGDGPARDYLSARGVRCITARYHVDFVGRGGWLHRILSFPYRYIRDSRHHRQAIDTLCRQLAETHIDIVHTNTAVLDFGPKLARRLGVPHVWHLREFIDLDMGFRPFLGWRYLRKTIQSTDATISITRAIAHHYGVEKLTNSHILFDAVRSRKDIKQGVNRLPQFVFCGQLAPHKGPDMAIRAFCRFAPTHPEFQFLLMGTAADASYEASLHNLVPAELHDRVRFMGYVKDTDTIFAQSAALLMCSRNEAQGRVTVEAMLQGCPVIALNSGGTREIITNKKTGHLFDDEQQLLDAMQQVIDDSRAQKDINSQAKEFAEEHFLEENYAPRVLDIYRALIQSK